MISLLNPGIQKWLTILMWAIGFYYVLILNQHFLIPLRYIPWVLIALVLLITFWQLNSAKSLSLNFTSYYPQKSVRLLLMLVCALSICFLIGTIFGQHSDVRSIFALLTIYIGPILLGVIGIFALPKNIKTVEFLCLASVVAILFLALTDTLHYARDWYRLGHFATDSSHRWFGDGYLFFIPWLLLGFIKSNGILKRCIWLAAIFWIFLLLSGTGSRAIIGIALLELVMFMSFYRRRFIAFILPLVLIAASQFGRMIMAVPTTVDRALKEGFYVQNRIDNDWLPALDFIQSSPWIGHGFSRIAWDKAYSIFLGAHPGWPGVNMGGPHNQMLDVAFIGGIFAAIFFLCICFYIVKILLGIVLKSPFELAGPALATLCSFIDFFLVRGLVESCRWEPLGITLMWVLLLSYLDKQRQYLTSQELSDGSAMPSRAD
jgi:O-antigen ligase